MIKKDNNKFLNIIEDMNIMLEKNLMNKKIEKINYLYLTEENLKLKNIIDEMYYEIENDIS